MGAYESAAATIIAQPDDVQADRQVRELLALTCYGRDMIPEARALFENLRPDTLGKSALFACADISFRDGNLSAALSLLKLAEAKEGILPAETELRNKTLIGESLLHTLFREDDETILVVNVAKGTAARYRSPHFKNLGCLDSIPDRDHFLFANTATSNNAWRAKLSETEARFVAEIVINENYYYEGEP